MRRTLSIAFVIAMVTLMWSATAMAGAKLQINDDSSIDLGFRVQTLWVSTDDADLDGDDSSDQVDAFTVRRARFRLKGVVNEYAECFIQTDITGADGVGADARVIDAYVNFKPSPWFQVIGGINMVPASRSNLTSSGALMAIDRPGLTYRALTWGARSRAGFNTGRSLGRTSGFAGSVDVRDAGATVFGSGAVGDNASFKYYVGMYNGQQPATEDNERFAVRGQLNFYDAEGGYYNSGTYLGKKKTIGIGAGLDTQSSVVLNDAGDGVDYTHVSADVFAEWPVADGSLSFEGGFTMLDFSEDMADMDGDGGADTAEVSLLATKGSGFYAQAGYFFNENWQPWALFETWTADADMDVGSYMLYRLGVTYFLKGHNANIKAGFEQTSLKGDNFFRGDQDKINTFVVGGYITY